MSEIILQIIKDSMNKRKIDIIDDEIKHELYILKRHVNIKYSHHLDSYYSQEQINLLKREFRK